MKFNHERPTTTNDEGRDEDEKKKRKTTLDILQSLKARIRCIRIGIHIHLINNILVYISRDKERIQIKVT